MLYPIGIQNFESLRKGGFAYVDKTDLVYQIAATGRYYFLSRPRRFGKSLLLSTLEAYFQGKKELFEGLAIENLEKDWASYPVLHLDLYQCGYLTLKESFPDFNACTLGFPNQEIRNGFLRMQLSYYVPKGGMDSDVLILRLYQSLVSGNPEEMMKILDGLFAKQNYQIQGKAEKNVQYAMSNNPPRFTMCTYIFDESTVWDIYEKFSFTGTEKEPLISVSSSLGMDEMGYRTAFYAANSFFFFLTNGFEFLLPHEVFESIIRQVSPEQAFSVQRLCVTWEEIVNAAEIEFITTTSSLMRYLETGYIYLTDVEYSLTAEERKEHIQTVLETMQVNPHIVIGVLPSFGGDSTYKGENVSFYSNYKTGFLKKNKKYIHNQASPFYLIVNRRLHSIFLKYFQSLKDLNVYHQYTLEQLNQKYDQYKPLIERTLSLK